MTANKNATIKRYMPVETFKDWVRFELQEVSLDTHKPVHFEGPLETEEILTSFKTTPWYQELINDSKVLALYLVGSRALDLHRPESDLDMVVILDEKGESIKTRPTICLAYKGTSVHYNAYGYDEIFQAHDITRSEKLFVQQLFVKHEPYAVYLSDKGQKLQKFFINNRNSLLTLRFFLMKMRLLHNNYLYSALGKCFQQNYLSYKIELMQLYSYICLYPLLILCFIFQIIKIPVYFFFIKRRIHRLNLLK